MIDFTLLTENGTANDAYGFKVSGHAGYAERGNDIVCSAVSLLVFGIINFVQTELKIGSVNKKANGDLVFTINKSNINIITSYFFKYMIYSLEMLREDETAKDRITIRIKGGANV